MQTMHWLSFSRAVRGRLLFYRAPLTQEQLTSLRLEKPKSFILITHCKTYAKASAYMQNTFNQNHAEGNFQNNLFPQHFTKTHVAICKSLPKVKAGLHPQCGEISYIHFWSILPILSVLGAQ